MISELLRRFRFLMIVCAMAFLAATWELSDPTRNVATRLPTRSDFPNVWAQLYPGDFETLHGSALAYAHRGQWAEARETMETALATGVTNSEALLYDYAVVLVYCEATQEEIDAAAGAWQYNFPHSESPDPRLGRFFDKLAPQTSRMRPRD